MFTQTKQNGSRTGSTPVLLVVFILSILSLLILPAHRGYIATTSRAATRLMLTLLKWLGALTDLGNNFVIWLSGLVLRLVRGVYRHYRARLVTLSRGGWQKFFSVGLNLAGLMILVALIRPSEVTTPPLKSYPPRSASKGRSRKEEVR
jgi:small-conductance mechanosensitive channel